jgi:hypothetical protein
MRSKSYCVIITIVPCSPAEESCEFPKEKRWEIMVWGRIVIQYQLECFARNYLL